MLQYLLTGLAGVALGIVAMRVWQSQGARPAGDAPVAAGVAEGDVVPVPSSRTRNLLVGAAALVAVALAVFALRPQEPDAGGKMAALPASGAGAGQKLDDVDTMIVKLAERLKKNPGDGDGFRMLGWSHVMTGHPEKAIAPYQQAMKLLPDNALVYSGYGEALTAVAGNTVTPQAKAAFDKAVALDPTEPRARYFMALWQAQHGQEKVALDKWIALANEGPADAPWQADVRRQITEVSGKLGVDVSARLKAPAPSLPVAGPPPLDSATVQSASQLSAGDRQAMIDGMVERLANKLKANPNNPDGWIQLLRSRMVLKQPEQAASDLAAARAALSGKAADLRKINAAAAELGVPGAR